MKRQQSMQAHQLGKFARLRDACRRQRDNTAVCQDPVLALGAKSGPQGSFGGYFTHLAGVNLDGMATDLGLAFTWTSNMWAWRSMT
jgi:hypothetical protein